MNIIKYLFQVNITNNLFTFKLLFTLYLLKAINVSYKFLLVFRIYNQSNTKFIYIL